MDRAKTSGLYSEYKKIPSFQWSMIWGILVKVTTCDLCNFNILYNFTVVTKRCQASSNDGNVSQSHSANIIKILRDNSEIRRNSLKYRNTLFR